MVYKSRFQISIPHVGLPTFVFGHPTRPLSEKPQFIDTRAPETRYLSNQAYRLWSKRLAVGLQKAGLKPGDRVLLFSGNTIYFPAVLVGVIMAGGIFTGANPGYVARELAYQLTDSGATFMICAEASAATALEAAQQAGLRKDRIFLFDDGVATSEGRGQDAHGLRHWTKLLASEAEARDWAWEELSSPEQLNRTICLNYSSGTTGAPKGVEITHQNYVANCEQAHFVTRLEKDFEARREKTRWLLFLPMYHAMAQTGFAITAPVLGYPVYIMPKFDFVQMLESVQKFKINQLILVPPIVLAIAKSPLSKKYDLSSVDRVVSGAAPLGMELAQEFEKLWPNGQVNVKQGWGMTEATCTVASWLPDQVSTSFSVGELAPNAKARLVDPEGNDVKKGERGEIWINAPNVMKGYWKRPKETKETVADGWLKTGDIAEIDDEGKIYIVDRMKELIKVKGLQVAPAELEAILLDHPAVGDAAVIGVTTKNGEEAPRAYIVLSPGAKATAEEIAQFLAGKVSKAKQLTGGVVFIDAIPKNPSGKILRKQLRELAKSEFANSSPRARL